jgi:hypothetical protein
MIKCKICGNEITGRSDKKFCSVLCKNNYHTTLRRSTSLAVKEIDTILHRNHGILLEIMGKDKSQLKCLRIELEKRKFNFKYHTHTNTNSAGKVYQFVYDFAWMTFSNDEVLIVRKK